MSAFPHHAGRALERRRPAWPALARLSDGSGEHTVSIRDVSPAGLSVFADGHRAGDALGVVLLAATAPRSASRSPPPWSTSTTATAAT